MVIPRVRPATYRRIALVALVAQAAIVATGGAVRLTGSGLGCPSWPSCTTGSLTPELSFHPLVEFLNRVAGVLVGLTALAAVSGALLRRPRRRDLTLLAIGLLFGFLMQAVLGGLTVIFDLSPLLVMAHFLLSMLLLVVAFALWRRSGSAPGPRRGVVPAEVLLLGRAVATSAAAVLVLGTVVTGSGPNSGAPAVRRLPFPLGSAAQLHSDAVLLLTGLTLALALVLRMVGAPAGTRRRARLLLAVIAIQAGIGFTQFFLDVARARALVALHILGATLFWLATLALLDAMYEHPPEPPEEAEAAVMALARPYAAAS